MKPRSSHFSTRESSVAHKSLPSVDLFSVSSGAAHKISLLPVQTPSTIKGCCCAPVRPSKHRRSLAAVCFGCLYRARRKHLRENVSRIFANKNSAIITWPAGRRELLASTVQDLRSLKHTKRNSNHICILLLRALILDHLVFVCQAGTKMFVVYSLNSSAVVVGGR